MRYFWLFLPLLIIVGCESEEQKKASVDAAYEAAKSLPASMVCENESAYRNLLALEKSKGTSLYRQLASEKISLYSKKCDAQKAQIAAQKARKAKELAAQKAKEAQERAAALAEKKLRERLSQVTDNMHVLGYVADQPTDAINCKNYTLDESFFGDSYYCEYRRSSTDIIRFHSDPYTKVIGKIFRFTLIERSQAQLVKDKVLERYGKPKVENFKEDEWVDEWQAAWGQVKMNYESTVQDIVFESPANTRSVRFYFDDCESSFSTCSDVFGVKNDASKLLARTYLFGKQSRLNSSALTMKKDPRKKPEVKKIKTQDAGDIDI